MAKNMKDTKAYIEAYIGNEAEEQDISLVNNFVAIMLQDKDIPRECQKWLRSFGFFGA